MSSVLDLLECEVAAVFDETFDFLNCLHVALQSCGRKLSVTECVIDR